MPRKIEEKYIWTSHAQSKMRHYRLSESRVKRIVRHPVRIEEGVAEDTVAVMAPAGGTKYSEVWVMYKISRKEQKITVITAWRYPGKSSERDPIPPEVVREVREIVGV